MNAALDLLNTVMDAVIGALAVGLQATARAMLANIHSTEWTLGLLLALSCWLIVSRRWSTAVGVVLLALAVVAGAWLSWKTGHTGASVQQAALAVMVLHGLAKGRGWALLKGGRK